MTGSQALLDRKSKGDRAIAWVFHILGIACASFIVIIILFILIKGLDPFFKEYRIDDKLYRVNLFDFLTGDTWFKYPNKYGIGFVILDTIYVTILALLLATPLSILSALFIVRIAPKPLAHILNTSIELLSSIPSIIYGVFGMGVITTMVKAMGNSIGIQTAGGFSMLSMVIVLALMIYPTITMVSITSIRAVKASVIQGSLALGASQTETNFKVVLSSAKTGIFVGITLGVGRALGEATAISMVCASAGSGPNFNIFDSTRTLTTSILLGMSETTGLDYDIRFSVAVVLIILILVTNLALAFVKRRVGRME